MDTAMLKFFNAADGQIPMDARGFLDHLNFMDLNSKLAAAITKNRYPNAETKLKKL